MHVLVTCKNEVDPIKNEGARVFTRFFHYKSIGIFPDAQGQLTPQSLVRSGQISNSCEMLWVSSLPASMKRIRSKMKVLECSQDFPHYKPMGAIRCHGKQSSNPIWPKTYCSFSPTQVMLQIKFDRNWPTGLRDIHVWKCLQTDGRTQGSWLDSHPTCISSPCEPPAQVS